MDDQEKRCNLCQNKGVKLKRCTRCRNVHYCSKECQSKEWSTHKLMCQKQTVSDETQTVKRHKITDDLNKEQKVERLAETQNETNPLCDEKEARRTEQQKNVLDQESAKEDDDDNNKSVADITDTGPGLKASSGQLIEACTQCGVSGPSRRCSRCKTAYCSRECQRKDWPLHKIPCTEDISEEDKRITRTYLEEKKKLEENKALLKMNFITQTFVGSPGRFFQTLTYEQAMLRAKRPAGSLKAAVKMAEEGFPGFEIITKFVEVPDERLDLSMSFLFPRVIRSMLVAFMYRYHDHVMRHGVYLKDEDNQISKVEFYLDEYFDDPRPFFSYEQVKPGGYICLMDPEMHVFGDGSVGIRINHPQHVVILDV